jgi:hypothetical protein
VVVPGSTLQVSQLDGDALSIVGLAVSLSPHDRQSHRRQCARSVERDGIGYHIPAADV